MFARRKLWVIGGSIALLGAVGAGAAFASGGFGDDQPLTGSAYQRATRAALDHTGGGTVIETEAGDDGAAYGVEIRLDDSSVVEVTLDEHFNVIGEEPDDDGRSDGEEPDDD